MVSEWSNHMSGGGVSSPQGFLSRLAQVSSHYGLWLPNAAKKEQAEMCKHFLCICLHHIC